MRIALILRARGRFDFFLGRLPMRSCQFRVKTFASSEVCDGLQNIESKRFGARCFIIGRVRRLRPKRPAKADLNTRWHQEWAPGVASVWRPANVARNDRHTGLNRDERRARPRG